MAIDRHHNRRWWLAVAALTALALLLRLLVWRWRELYPLGVTRPNIWRRRSPSCKNGATSSCA